MRAPRAGSSKPCRSSTTINAPKQLHLIFERDVDGEAMAQSFREAIGMGHPAPAFAPELAKHAARVAKAARL